MWGRNKQLEAVRELGLSKEAVRELCEMAQTDDRDAKLLAAFVSELILQPELAKHLFDMYAQEESDKIARFAEKYAEEKQKERIRCYRSFGQFSNDVCVGIVQR